MLDEALISKNPPKNSSEYPDVPGYDKFSEFVIRDGFVIMDNEIFVVNIQRARESGTPDNSELKRINRRIELNYTSISGLPMDDKGIINDKLVKILQYFVIRSNGKTIYNDYRDDHYFFDNLSDVIDALRKNGEMVESYKDLHTYFVESCSSSEGIRSLFLY